MFIKVGSRVLKVKNCNGFASLCGLAFDDMKKHNGALIYSNNIWMPFVKHELDLLFLDSDFKILDIQRAIPLSLNPKTWKYYKNKNARYCLELKSGLVSARKGLKVIINIP